MIFVAFVRPPCSIFIQRIGIFVITCYFCHFRNFRPAIVLIFVGSFCNLQVQEVPQDVFQGRDIFAGPILRVLCSSRATFLEPVTIQLPVSLGGSVLNIPHDTVCRVRVFYLSSERETREWVEISNELENPASFDGRVVKFKVRGFSRYAVYRRLLKLTGRIIC